MPFRSRLAFPSGGARSSFAASQPGAGKGTAAFPAAGALLPLRIELDLGPWSLPALLQPGAGRPEVVLRAARTGARAGRAHLPRLRSNFGDHRARRPSSSTGRVVTRSIGHPLSRLPRHGRADQMFFRDGPELLRLLWRELHPQASEQLPLFAVAPLR